MIITQARWLQILAECGVQAGVALKWSKGFEAEIQPSNFNLGLQEIDDFVAQVLYETGNLQHLEENLNYTPQRLMEVWPSRFTSLAQAKRVAYDPKALATEVYGGRMGNDFADDGYTYRGRGIPMITGKDNYALAEKLSGFPLLAYPDLLSQDPTVALRCGRLWWERKIPDDAIDSVDRVTRLVNGGTLGINDRRAKYDAAHVALGKENLA